MLLEINITYCSVLSFSNMPSLTHQLLGEGDDFGREPFAVTGIYKLVDGVGEGGDTSADNAYNQAEKDIPAGGYAEYSGKLGHNKAHSKTKDKRADYAD